MPECRRTECLPAGEGEIHSYSGEVLGLGMNWLKLALLQLNKLTVYASNMLQEEL